MPAPDVKGDIFSIANNMSDNWVYAAVADVMSARMGLQVGQEASPIKVGLRDHSMRTPGQFQQNFPREVAMNEAAALAGADPLEFRIAHTKEQRLRGFAQPAEDRGCGLESRSSPNPNAASGSGLQKRCRAYCLGDVRAPGSYWACAAQITFVRLDTGKIKVDRIHHGG